jgi:hypothetical protein
MSGVGRRGLSVTAAEPACYGGRLARKTSLDCGFRRAGVKETERGELRREVRKLPVFIDPERRGQKLYSRQPFLPTPFLGRQIVPPCLPGFSGMTNECAGC